MNGLESIRNVLLYCAALCEWQMRPNQLSGFDIVDAFGLIETVASEDQAQHIVTAHNAAIRRAR